MQFLLFPKLYLQCYLYSAGCHGPLTLTSDPPPSSNGSYCTTVGTVFICAGTAERGINWVTNETIPAAAFYVFPNSEDTYPIPMLRPSGSPLDSPDINVTVVSASAVSAGSDVFNVVCTLTFGSSIFCFNNTNIHCEGDGGSRSNSTFIDVKDICESYNNCTACFKAPIRKKQHFYAHSSQVHRLQQIIYSITEAYT